MRHIAFPLILFVTASFTGCGGGGGSPDAGAPTADATAVFDAMPVPCPSVLANYGDLGMLQGEAREYLQDDMIPDGDKWYSFAFDVSGGVGTPDILTLELWPGYGALELGLMEGGYLIEDADLDYYSCGLCVLLDGDLDLNADPPTVGDTLFALQGSVTLTLLLQDPVAGTTVGGSLDDITLRMVEYDDDLGVTVDVPGGCQVELGSMSFQATAPPYTPPMQ